MFFLQRILVEKNVQVTAILMSLVLDCLSFVFGASRIINELYSVLACRGKDAKSFPFGTMFEKRGDNRVLLTIFEVFRNHIKHNFRVYMTSQKFRLTAAVV